MKPSSLICCAGVKVRQVVKADSGPTEMEETYFRKNLLSDHRDEDVVVWKMKCCMESIRLLYLCCSTKWLLCVSDCLSVCVCVCQQGRWSWWTSHPTCQASRLCPVSVTGRSVFCWKQQCPPSVIMIIMMGIFMVPIFHAGWETRTLTTITRTHTHTHSHTHTHTHV